MELKKVALFDLDGVVLDTEGQYTVFWQTIGERYCTEVPDFSTRIKGMSLAQILASHEKLQQHEHEIRKAIDEYEETMSYPYIPGAYAFLCALREARVPRAVVTSSNRAKMENVYRLLSEFESLFDRVFTADDITRSKPAPDCYLNAAHRMGADPTECVVFEDSINGLKSGRAAGAYVVGLSTSCAERDIVPLAEMVVPSFVDATTCLALFEKGRGR
jgi:HAD hydrolase, family IA, variant 3